MNVFDFCLGNRVSAHRMPEGEYQGGPRPFHTPTYSDGILAAHDSYAVACRVATDYEDACVESRDEDEVIADGSDQFTGKVISVAKRVLEIPGSEFDSRIKVEAVITPQRHTGIRINNRLMIDPYYFHAAFGQGARIKIEDAKNRILVMNGDHRAVIMKMQVDDLENLDHKWRSA